jgi:hypothetical protein
MFRNQSQPCFGTLLCTRYIGLLSQGYILKLDKIKKFEEYLSLISEFTGYKKLNSRLIKCFNEHRPSDQLVRVNSIYSRIKSLFIHH